MSKQDFFRDALSDFTFESASGGAIRHLADLGYTVKQISERLTYPTSYEKIRTAVWKHLIQTQVILMKEPGSAQWCGKADYVVEHDKYGRASFRLVPAMENGALPVRWIERHYSEEKDSSFGNYLAYKCSLCGEKSAYASCEFGLLDRKDQTRMSLMLEALNERQREYVEGLPWTDADCYHVLDGRMREIVTRLYMAGLYQGRCYFTESGEKVYIGAPVN